MNLVLFFYVAAFFSLALGEFGQFPFGKSDFSIALTDILLTLNLTAVLIWNAGINRNPKVPRNFIYLFLFWLVGLISLFSNLDFSGWLYLFRFIIYSSTFYITYHLVKSKILCKSEFFTLVKITNIVLAVIGLIQWVVFPDLGGFEMLGYDPHKYRVFSTFLDPNFLGAFLSLGFSLLIYELISKKFSSLKAFAKENRSSIISAVILGIAIILTFSRSAYLMFALSSGIILAFKSRKLLLAFFTSVLILYLIFPAFNERIQGAINLDKSASERFSSWEKGLIIFQENPALGIGFNNIRSYSQQMNLLRVFTADGGNSGAGIDSSLIFVMATTGILGVITFFGFLGKVLYDILNKFLKEKFPFSLTLLSIITGLILNSFFINSLFYPPIMFLFFSLLGVFYGLGEGEGEDS